MPSVRVRRSYYPLADDGNGTTNNALTGADVRASRLSVAPPPDGTTQDGTLEPPRPQTIRHESSLHELRASYPRTSVARPRSRTIASIFSSAPPPPPPKPTPLQSSGPQMQAVSSSQGTTRSQGAAAGTGPRRGSVSHRPRSGSSAKATVGADSDDDVRPLSWVANSIRRGSVTTSAFRAPQRESSALATDGSGSRRQTQTESRLLPYPNTTDHRRASIISAGGDGVGVDVLLSDEDLHGAIGSALTVPRRESDRNRPSSRGSRRSVGSPPPPELKVQPPQEDGEGEHAPDLDNVSDDGSYMEDEHHLDEVVEHLDVVDPHIATVSHLSNAANSILIPPISLYNRRPVVTLPTLTPSDSDESLPNVGDDLEAQEKRKRRRSQYRDELDIHVEHLLSPKKKTFRRVMHGVWAFLKTPTGIIAGVYGFLCAFWGAAIVLFLVKAINLHNAYEQKKWIEISSQVENGLFTLTGVGLIPWRTIDTCRILKIWYYKRLTHKLRKKGALPKLDNENDLPDPKYNPNYVHVLTDKQQAELSKQQTKFMGSQTWYRPHATETHRAFPINTALLICLLIDGNSIFQCVLCGTMWGLNRYNRPAWTTGCLIPASFLCGIAAAIIIWKGGQRTKKTAEVEQRLRDALAQEKEGLLDNYVGESKDWAVVGTKEEGEGSNPSSSKGLNGLGLKVEEEGEDEKDGDGDGDGEKKVEKVAIPKADGGHAILAIPSRGMGERQPSSGLRSPTTITTFGVSRSGI